MKFQNRMKNIGIAKSSIGNNLNFVQYPTALGYGMRFI